MKIGTIGAGQIADEILKGVQAAEGVSCGAVYSRGRDTGAALAERFGVDLSGTLVMRYPDFVCTCERAKDTWGVNSAQIQGERGFLHVKDSCNWFSEVTPEIRGGRRRYNT